MSCQSFSKLIYMTSITLVKQGLVKIWRWNCSQRTSLSLSCNCAQHGFVRKMGFTVWFAAHEQHQLCECVSSDTKSWQSILSAGSMREGELLSCCERVKVILESGVWPQESSGLGIACNLSMWEGVWRQFLVNVATVWFLWNQQNDETPRREIPFLRQVFKIWKMCVYALCITMWKTYKLAEGWKQLMVVTQSSFHVLWQRELIQFHRKSSNKTIIWLSCPFLFHDFLPHVTKRSLQNTWLNHPLLYKSSWMGITNPVFGQLHFLECFSQASARDSVYIVYRVCKCYQLFENSIKCYQEHLQILASSHIAKDVES